MDSAIYLAFFDDATTIPPLLLPEDLKWPKLIPQRQSKIDNFQIVGILNNASVSALDRIEICETEAKPRKNTSSQSSHFAEGKKNLQTYHIALFRSTENLF
jgi:hypothetical protein